MTDIIKLTAKLKAAAQEALEPHDRLSVLPPDDIFDISLVEGTQIDADITAINAFHDEATPANILVLIQALDELKVSHQVKGSRLTDYLHCPDMYTNECYEEKK